MPSKGLLRAAETTKALTEKQFALLLAAITRAMKSNPNAARDYVLIKGPYLLGCRVSEIARLKWGDIKALGDGGQVHFLDKGPKSRVVRVSSDTLALFESLGRNETDHFVFPSPRCNRHLTRQAIGDLCRKWGKKCGLHVHPHQLRRTHAIHAIKRGTDVPTGLDTLGVTENPS